MYLQNTIYGAMAVFASENTPPVEQKQQLKTLETNVVTHEMGHTFLGGEHSSDPNNIMTSEPQKWMRKESRGFDEAQLKKIRQSIPEHQSKVGRPPEPAVPQKENRAPRVGIGVPRPSRQSKPSGECHKSMSGCKQ